MYQVFLERENLGDGGYQPISLDEWIKVLKTDPDLEYTNNVKPGKYYAKWANSCDQIWFKFEAGIIYTYNCAAAMQKLREFSIKLKGQIYGENFDL
jgi:hypothetical protein